MISSYLVANQETARRGIVLSFVSALLQALVAVVLVGVCAWLLNVTAKTMCGAERAIEIASYGLIAAFGARLVWTKGGGFVRAFQAPRAEPALAAAHHDHDHDHIHDEHCGHSHGPTPDQLSGPGGWRRGLGAIIAVGLRPCSGAILVLVFALAQGLFWAGIVATFVMGLGTAITVATIAVVAVSAKDVARRLSAGREGGGALIMRGIEFGAAGLVLLFGLGLLFGYLAAERGEEEIRRDEDRARDRHQRGGMRLAQPAEQDQKDQRGLEEIIVEGREELAPEQGREAPRQHQRPAHFDTSLEYDPSGSNQTPLIPAKAGIQSHTETPIVLALDPRLRGGERPAA